MSDSVSDLIEEINFWKYMLKEYENRQFMPEYRQMSDSLALAEHKLQRRVEELGGRH